MATHEVASYELHPPPLDDIAFVIGQALSKNFETASVSVAECPDLRDAPFCLAAQGLSGNERIADIGGQPNLYPEPKFDARYSLLDMAKHMQLDTNDGMLIGAGAGPFFDVGVNSELAPNISWTKAVGQAKPTVTNLTRYVKVNSDGSASCQKSPTANFALMMNLFGSEGVRGPVLKIQARKRVGKLNLTDCIRFALRDQWGSDKIVSLGGLFVIKKGTAKFHVMPDFPPADQMPFKSPGQLNEWLTYHNFGAPMVCLTVFHSADPHKLGLRMEHTHCFGPTREDQGGHYHEDVKSDAFDDIEYEGYLNTAKVLFRIDQPDVLLSRDLHD